MRHSILDFFCLWRFYTYTSLLLCSSLLFSIQYLAVALTYNIIPYVYVVSVGTRSW